MYSVEAGLDKMFGVETEELDVEQSKWDDCVSFEKVD